MSRDAKNYSDFTSRVCGLIGIPFASLQDTEVNFLNGYFNTNVHQFWDSNSWLDMTVSGEARLVGNTILYANDYSIGATYWSILNGTVSVNQFANPADARVTAGLFVEDTSFAAHGVGYAGTRIDVVPDTPYVFQIFVRPKGRDQIYVEIDNSPFVSTYAVFDLTGNGAVSDELAPANCTPSINQALNGFYVIQMSFTTASNAVSVAPYVTGWDSNNNYTGDGTSGFYTWGWWFGQAQNFPANQLIPWEQTGEEPIESVVQVWQTNPFTPGYPRPQAYQMTRDGIEIINAQGTYGGPFYNNVLINAPFSNSVPISPIVYVDYRRPAPRYEGDDWDDALTYSKDDQVLYTDTDNVTNYFKALQDVPANYAPTSYPTYWEALTIPDQIFDAVVYASYADWLRMDGQLEKAAAMDGLAQKKSDQESDRQERQMGVVPPMKVQTHVTSQPRWY